MVSVLAKVIPASMVFLTACGSAVAHRERIPFSGGEVELVITSVGSALGDEKYELKFDNGGKSQTFFIGANFSEFRASERGSKFSIQMCKGFIDHAEPIGVDQGEKFDVVPLDLDWNCADPRHGT